MVMCCLFVKAQFELSTGGNVEDLGQEDDEPTCTGWISALFSNIQFISHVSSTGLQVCCGKAGVRGKHSVVTLPSEAARAEFVQVNACPPSNPAKFALKLLSVFFTQDELAESNCTKADGRKLLDQDILQAIKREGFCAGSACKTCVRVHITHDIYLLLHRSN